MHMSPNEALTTPARRFFAVLKATKNVFIKDRYLFLDELLAVVHAPDQKPKYTDQLRRQFKKVYQEKVKTKHLPKDEQLRQNRSVASRLQMIVPTEIVVGNKVH